MLLIAGISGSLAAKDKADKEDKQSKVPPTVSEIPAVLQYGAGVGALGLAFVLARIRKGKK